MQVTIIPVASRIAKSKKLNVSQYARQEATTMSALVEKRLMLDSAKLTRKECVWIVSEKSQI